MTRHNIREAKDGAHRSIVHLEVVLRDVDAEDIRVYLPDDPDWLHRYSRELDDDDRGDSC